jgi:hypothetical protein
MDASETPGNYTFPMLPRKRGLTSRCGGARCKAVLLLAYLGTLVTIPSCLPQCTLTYLVTVPDPSVPFVDITLTIQGAPARAFDLVGFAAREVMRADRVHATGPNGALVAMIEVADSVESGDRRVPIPRYRIVGRPPSTLTVRYRVSPGRREGDDHIGFSGRAFGYLGSDFGMVTGRNLFLLPDPTVSFQGIQVAFCLPKGWRAVTPWRPSKDRWVVEAPPASASDLLVTASIGFGSFRERSFSVGRTKVRLDFSSTVPDGEVQRSALAIERVVRYVGDVFGRDLGGDYVAIVVPETPNKDEIAGEGWAFGQGGTLAPLTPARLRKFAQRLIEAYTLHAPFRTEIRYADEFWLVDGVTNWYSWRAVAAAGLADEEEVGRSFISAYLTAMTTEGVGRDLEQLYADSPNRLAREVLAPFVLFYLDHQLRVAEHAPFGFDPFLRRLYASRFSPRLWSLLPGNSAGKWEPFRTRYVRGKAVAPVPDLFAIAPTRASPSPPGGAPARFITIAYTGNTYGYLENCGCKANQSGGVARRATVLDRIRARDPEALVLDAGNTFPRPERSDGPSFLADKELRFYLQALDLMKYHVAAVGLTELAWSPEYFRDQARGLKMPFLAANVLMDGKEMGPPYRVLRSHGMTVMVIGLLEPPRGGTALRGFSESAARLTFSDPADAIRRILLRERHADITLVLGTLSPWMIRRITSACPEVDVIVSTNYDAPQWLYPSNARHPVIGTDDSTGFVSQTLVLYTYKGQYGIATARLGVDRLDRIVSADRTELWLDERVPDYPMVRDRLNHFYDEIGKTELAQASVRPPLAGDPYWQHRSYVGASVCAGCHVSQYAQWKTTPHATAFKTLLDRHRHYQPSCVSCHVVGFGSEYGYKVGQPEDPFGNVQCEVCHGPGGDHVRGPIRTNIRRAVPERVCLECHNPDHSDHFVYTSLLPQVIHERPVQLTAH